MPQYFKDKDEQVFEGLAILSGCSWSVLAEPVPQGSIHRLKIQKGACIPPHTHPDNEYVFVLSGKILTGQRECEQGCFWITPGGTLQGPHFAITDVEILTIRLGPMGKFW